MSTSKLEHTRKSTLSLGGTVSLPAGNWTAVAKLVREPGASYEDFPENHLEVLLAPPEEDGGLWGVLVTKDANLQEDWPVDETVIGNIVYEDLDAEPPVRLSSENFKIEIEREIA